MSEWSRDEDQHGLPDSRKVNSHESKDETAGSSGESEGSRPLCALTLNSGSLTLAQLVEQIEAASGDAGGITQMHGRIRRRYNRLPVARPQGNADRFAGQGNQLVDDVVWTLAGRQRLSTHGIIQFVVVRYVCCLVCLILMAIITFPLGLIFLCCVPCSIHRRCGTCGRIG